MVLNDDESEITLTLIILRQWEAEMRLNFWVKLGMLVVLGVITHWTTSSLIAQSQASKRKNARAQVSAVTQDADVAEPVPALSNVLMAPRIRDAKALRPQKTPQESLVAFVRSGAAADATLLSMDAVTNGRQVSITQVVHLLERSPDTSYLWALRISKGATKQTLHMVSQHYYMSQIFQVPVELMQLKPTFRETFALAPGVYVVEVSLLRVPAGFDPRRLDEENIKQLRKMSYAARKLVIAD